MQAPEVDQMHPLRTEWEHYDAIQCAAETAIMDCEAPATDGIISAFDMMVCRAAFAP